MTINFKVTRDEQDVIASIVERTIKLYEDARAVPPRRMDLTMDITAAHANGCPLDLEGLRDARPADFLHDVSGIMRHINRETGALEGFFLPRYHRRPAVTQ